MGRFSLWFAGQDASYETTLKLMTRRSLFRGGFGDGPLTSSGRRNEIDRRDVARINRMTEQMSRINA